MAQGPPRVFQDMPPVGGYPKLKDLGRGYFPARGPSGKSFSSTGSLKIFLIYFLHSYIFLGIALLIGFSAISVVGIWRVLQNKRYREYVYL